MSQVTVRGYHEGVAYAALLDTDNDHPSQGVFAQAPIPVIAAVEALTGQAGTTTGTGNEVTIGLDSIEGAVAGLIRATEIVGIDGAVPGDEPEDEQPVGPVDY